MTIETAGVQTSFQIGESEIRSFPFAIPVSIGTKVDLPGEDGNGDKDFRVIGVSLKIDERPTIVVEIGEQAGPGATPI